MPTLYVNAATGLDSRTYAQAQSSATPWLTIGRACWGSTNDPNSVNAGTAAQAGDTVSVAAGTYWENGLTLAQGADRFTVALNPANSGTVGNPITFQGAGDVYIRLLLDARGPMIGSNGRDYIYWDNFIIDDYYGGSLNDTGPVSLYNCASCHVTNSEVIALGGTPSYHGYQHAQEGTITSSGTTLTGTGTAFQYYGMAGRTIVAAGQTLTIAADVTDDTTMTVTVAPSPALTNASFTASAYGGNYRLVALEQADDNYIYNNLIHGSPISAAGVLMYDSNRNIIEHNEVNNTQEGIYIKGTHPGLTQEGNIVRYNLLYDIDLMALHQESGTAANYWYQNIVYNSDRGLYSGAFGSYSPYFFNNTCYNLAAIGIALLEETPGWDANTAYVVGDRRNNGGNYYVCDVAGTSAASGGPTGTGANITDNTCRWDYTVNKSLVDGRFHNNIIHTSPNAYYTWQVGTPANQDFAANRNCFYNITGNFAEYTGISFATWQGTYSKDANSTNGTDPQFVNTGTYDFHLANNGQGALTLGRATAYQATLGIGLAENDVIPVGAYISGNEVIGIDAGGAPADIPRKFTMHF